MKLIVGLGNPGKKYEQTRHNVGFIILDWLKDNLFNNFSNWQLNKKFNAEISQGTIDGQKIILAKPETFMNNSGLAVKAIVDYYKINVDDIIIIHDDLDIELGNYKIQKDRSSAGHNGIKSIIQHLGTQNFLRIRIGIAKSDKQRQGATEKFVLNRFNLFEKLKLKQLKDQVTSEIKNLI